MNFGGGLPGDEAHFDGANYFLGVGCGDAGGGLGIETDQEAMKMGGAAKFGAGTQAVADFFGTLGGVGEAFEQGAEIETGSGGNDWKFFTKAQVVQNFEGAAAILSCGENFVRIEQIDEVVGDALLLGGRNFSGADVEVAGELRGIADQDLAVQFFGEFDAERGFARGGGTENYD